MTDATDFDTAAADAASGLFRRIAPEAAEICTPFLPRLFRALHDGHSFIWVGRDEAQGLAQAAPLADTAGRSPLVLQGRRLFLGRIWQLERDLAEEILRLAAAPPQDPHTEEAAQRLADWFPGEGSRGQQAAAALALLQNFMLISGGPGTGKTTTVAKLLALLSGGGDFPRIALAAPTGKAAAHMTRALRTALNTFPLPPDLKQHLSEIEGQTVHRLLKLRPPQMQPQFDKRQPLPLDILVADEASMLDLPLMLNLLRAIPDGCRVILLGDENQLPSVGAGAVLAALAQPTVLGGTTAQKLQKLLPHGEIPFQTAAEPPPLSENAAHLTFSHRFGKDSGLGCLARAVTAGQALEAWRQFALFPQELAVWQADTAKQAAAFCRRQSAYWQAVDELDIERAFACQGNLAVLAARRDDAERFNHACRSHLQQQGRIPADTPWFAGQVIMIERNDYPLNLFNGDIGLVLRDTAAQDALAAYFPAASGWRKIALSRLPAHNTAFAMTVHKSQGSEYRQVWLLPPAAAETGGLSRALLYTAITRARENFVFCGTQAAFTDACENNETRRSALKNMLARLSRPAGTTAENTGTTDTEDTEDTEVFNDGLENTLGRA
ncbi:MAG: exodeoxyribonuclease V subunit alpha [Neisseria sp.]|nr:exodeoxyribonuclease V subunit alpha [Neisseria sp.]